MITSLEAIDTFYLYLRDSILLSDPLKPTGKLVKGDRDEDSKAEDVVIDAIGGITRTPVQRGVLLLNLYANNLDPATVPNIGKGNNKRDTGRLKQLAILAQRALLGEDGELWLNQDTCYEVSSDEVFEDEGNNQHYVSFRINFYTIK